MDFLTLSWQFFTIVFLLAANGFFVAAEFAIVKVRHSQLKPHLEKGDWRASIALDVIKNMDHYLSACQVGITLTSIGLGWVGEPFVEPWIKALLRAFGVENPTVITSVAFFVAYFAITFLHIVVGEQAPKMFAIQRPRRVALWLTPFLLIFNYVFRPFIWIVNASSNKMLHWMGLEPAVHGDQPFSHEELTHMLLHSTHVHPGDEMINTIMLKALRQKETTARQIMIPAEQVIVLWADKSLDENLKTAQKAGYSRFPLSGRTCEEVIGIIHIKELLWQVLFLGKETKLENIKHAVLTFLPGTKLPAMLELFRRSRNHMAVVVDQNDLMIGIVTFEDVLEELVGDIRDEFDVERGPILEKGENTILVDGDMSLRDLAVEMDWPLPTTSSATTVEKWCLEQWNRIPEAGEELELNGLKIVAVEPSKRGLRRVRLIKQK